MIIFFLPADKISDSSLKRTVKYIMDSVHAHLFKILFMEQRGEKENILKYYIIPF